MNPLAPGSIAFPLQVKLDPGILVFAASVT